MIPKSFSASALNVAELCLARYKAEQIIRGQGMSGGAASLGTSVHGGLEMFVKATRPELGGDMGLYALDVLEMMFRKSFMDTFSTSDPSGDLYDDGWEMLERWFGRTNWDGVTVVSVEVKENFPIPTSVGEIPFNYIWDRFDQIGPRSYKVVDYKTNRWALQPADLKKKIQARCYGLASAIKLKSMGLDVDEIWVEFDMLRHDPVGISYSREDNAATWKFIKTLAERIIATDPNDTPETLNGECRFCIRKLKCGALQSNIAAGGSFSISSAEEAIDLRAALDYQAKAITSAIADLDEIILGDAKAKDVLEFESAMNRLKIVMSGRRAIDPERARLVIGEDLFSKYGSASLSMKDVDKLLKGRELTDVQKKQLGGLLYTKRGEPRVAVESKNSLEDE